MCRYFFSAHNLIILIWVVSSPNLFGFRTPPLQSSPAAGKGVWCSGCGVNRNQRLQGCFSRAIYTYAVASLESEPSPAAQSTEPLPGMINTSHFSSLICLHFVNISSEPLPLASSGSYQQPAKKSFPADVWNFCVGNFLTRAHEMWFTRVVIWGFIREV